VLKLFWDVFVYKNKIRGAKYKLGGTRFKCLQSIGDIDNVALTTGQLLLVAHFILPTPL